MDNYNIILITVSGLFWLCGFWFLFRIPLCRQQENIKEYPSVSIIIPARNEENNIGTLLDSINIQSYRANELIVVNDSSTDRTKEISIEKGATVIDSEPLPVGWLGKPWACFQGAEKAKSDLFIFLDSDIELERDGLSKIVDTYIHESQYSDLVMSISPYHKVKKAYEELSAFFNIIMTGSMNAFTPLIHSKPTGLFGPTLILSKQNYYKINGHESVKDKILENVFMAKKFKSLGIQLKCFGGRGAISFRMYPDGIKDLVNGWTKAFASGAGMTPTLILINIIFWISSGFIISIALSLAIHQNNYLYLWISFYLAFAIQLYWMLKRIGSFHLISALLFPVHLLFYCIVFFRSLYYQLTHKKINWKSREVNT